VPHSCGPDWRAPRHEREISNLRALDLSHNVLSHVNTTTFLEPAVVKLVNLSLANNVIRCVAQWAFLELAELERLDLSANNLISIHPDTFNHTLKLYWLSLAGNKLFTLPSQRPFIFVGSLTFLDMSNCSVTDIPQVIFKYINNITYLNVSHNSIRDIQQGTFHYLKQLTCLDISFNQLTSLHADAFSNCIQLSGFHQSDSCEWSSEPERSSLVVRLNVDNNPWNCDCKMKVLFDYISKHGSTLLNVTCKTPSSLEDSSWEVLKGVDCSTSTESNTKLITEESAVSISRSVPASAVYNSLKEECTVANILTLIILTITIILVVIIIIIIIIIWLYYRMKKLQRQNIGKETSDTEMQQIETRSDTREQREEENLL